MSELSVSTKQLLAAAREGLAPDRATIARMQTRIGAASVASTKATIAGKLALAAVAAGALTTAVVLATRTPAPSAPPPPVPSPPPPPSEVQLVPSIPVPPPPEVVPQPAPKRTPTRATKAVATLAREVELLDSAEHASTTGDINAARTYLRLYARETAGHGQLLEDAAALSVELGCRDRDATAAASLAAFDARWPHSAHRARLIAACGGG